MTTITGVIHVLADAESAVQELITAGWMREDISVITSRQADSESPDKGLAVKDAEKGAIVGGLAGLFLGLTELAIPGIGLVVVGGWLATTLLGAGLGATAGGLTGALVEAGIGHDEASRFAENLRQGDTLLAIKTDVDRRPDVLAILNRRHAENVREWSAERAPGD